MIHLKNIALSALFAASIGSVATPAQAFSLRDTEHGEFLFQTFNSLVRSERLQLADSDLGLTELNPESLRWEKGSTSVDVFFINEGAGYRNQLFYTANGGEKQMIFADIASTASVLSETNGPLALGDGANLGTFVGDTVLDFIIKANGANNPNGHSYGANVAANPDGLQHVIAYEYFDDVMKESWVILGFEDLHGGYAAGGSDRDFNDVVVAVKGLTTGPVEATSQDVPEPSAMLSLLVISGLMGVTRR
jgi:hypothetical protein